MVMALSSGTFLYVGLIELLAKQVGLPGPHNHHNEPCAVTVHTLVPAYGMQLLAAPPPAGWAGERLLQLLLVAVGWFLMALLAMWT